MLQKRLKKLKKTVYEEPEELKRAPHSFVIHRGQIGKSLLQLVKDFRKVMEPFTAASLQVTYTHKTGILFVRVKKKNVQEELLLR